MKPLQGRTCVVTGASSGIGRVTAWRLAGAGAEVVLAARREDRLEELAGLIEDRGGRAWAVPCNVTKRTDLRTLVRRVEREAGRCDVLVNNAGVPGGRPFAEATLDDLEKVVATNLTAVMAATRLFLPLLVESGGHVVNVASLAGRYAVPGAAAYTASKHGVVGLSESLHQELRPMGVMVTTVNPGVVDTEGFPMGDLMSDPLLGRFVMDAERVAEVIEDVVINRRGPEVSVPRWLAGPQVFRMLTPGLYRAGVRMVVSRRHRTKRGFRNEG